MKASVVVPTLNEEKYIGKCLESVRSQTVGCELVVVDSGSVDRTLEVAGKYADKILMTDRKIISYNRQVGAEAASGEIIVTTDADCVHIKNWLELLLGHFNDPEVVAVSGPTVPMPEEAIFLDRVCYFVGNLSLRILHSFGRVWFRGSNTAYRKDAFIKAGGYDTEMVAREDSEFSQRLSRIGKTVFDSRIVVYTSMRRRRSMGWLKTIRYYLDTPISILTGKTYYRKV